MATQNIDKNSKAQGLLPDVACSPLVREALERCIQLDESAAADYRADAVRCAVSRNAIIRERGTELIARAENRERRAHTYRAILAENASSAGTAGESKLQ